MSSNMIDGVMVDDSQNYSLKTKIVGNYRVSKLIPISGGQSFGIHLCIPQDFFVLIVQLMF